MGSETIRPGPQVTGNAAAKTVPPDRKVSCVTGICNGNQVGADLLDTVIADIDQKVTLTAAPDVNRDGGEFLLKPLDLAQLVPVAPIFASAMQQHQKRAMPGDFISDTGFIRRCNEVGTHFYYPIP